MRPTAFSFREMRQPGLLLARNASSLAACFFSALALPVHAQQPAPAAHRVYVSSEKDNTIQVFDPQGARLAAIEVCKRPRHMMFSRDRRQIYVSCGDSNQMGLVDIASARMTGTVPLGDSPEIFDLSPDGKIAFVSIEDENVMAAYDLQSRAKLFEVKTGGEPEGILVMPDGRHAYVTSEVANVVHLIDIAQRKVVKNIRVGNRPRRFVLAAGGKEVWVSNELGASVSIVSTEDHTVRQTLEFKVKGMRASDITPVGMALSPDGKTVWVALGRANHVAEVDQASRQVRNTILVGKRAWGLAAHPDGKTVYVANGLSDDMTLIDTAAGKAVRTVAVGRVPHSVLVQP
ncbi:MAG: beta-propeller repeat protein [Polaromonas sp.]|nr:beta-propeller repeat protein [Polaromonas sp.]